MIKLASVLLACFLVATVLAFDSEFLSQPVNDPVLIRKINGDSRRSWVATHYPQFEGKSLSDIRNSLGAILFQKGTADMTPMLEVNYQAAESFDARTKWPSCIHPIRNQEECGSCWAFSASEVLSDRLCIATNEKTNVVLSPEYMVACDKTNYGCDGKSIIIDSLFTQETNRWLFEYGLELPCQDWYSF